ncbi:MAG: HEAT repeat domain-containing protein [Gemmatimonadaceae bacterium]
MSAWAARLGRRGMLDGLRSPFTGERVQAAGGLREQMATDDRVVPALLRVLTDDLDPVVRCAAADALAHLAEARVDAAGTRQAIDGLVEAFRVDGAYAVRVRCAKTLQALGWSPADAGERATAAAMREDLDALRLMIRDGHRELVLAAVARELTDGRNTGMLRFIGEVGAGSPAMIGALERFMHERDVGEGREVLAALRASVAAPSDGAHGTLRRVTGHSLFYRCPSCGATLRKADVEGVPTALGWTSCGRCAASYSYADVYYHGKYDVPEVEGACFVCGASLRGPEAELSGRPCPSCGVTLPVVAAVK